jgi:hypothetical protein
MQIARVYQCIFELQAINDHSINRLHRSVDDRMKRLGMDLSFRVPKIHSENMVLVSQFPN